MKGKVTVDLGGKERELKFGTLGIMSAEKELGLSALTGELFSKISLNSLVVLTWAALLHSNRKLTIDQVTEWIPFEAFDGDFAGNLMNSLLKAYLIGKGEDPEEVEKKMAEISKKTEPEEEKEAV